MRKLFSVISSDAEFDAFSTRTKRLIIGAINYHSLINVGRTITYKIYLGENWQYPRLTDISTITGRIIKQGNVKQIASITAQSNVGPTQSACPIIIEDGEQIADAAIRHILLTDDDATDSDVDRHKRIPFSQKVYRMLERSNPVLLDRIREHQRVERENRGLAQLPAFDPTIELAPDDTNRYVQVSMSGPVQYSNDYKQPAVIIGMHWLQPGGAERWAMETIELVRKNGMLPIVITDRDSHQPWITNSLFDEALVLNLTPPFQKFSGDSPLLEALFSIYSIHGTLIHHCQWLYDRTFWIKQNHPQVPIVDSLHIVEYRYCGGYPSQAVRFDSYIDYHHVISPQLEDWLTNVHGLDNNKVLDAPLVGLTASNVANSCKPKHNDNSLSIAFIGRITRQKRPESFVLLAKELIRKTKSFRFIMHGSGDMEDILSHIIKSEGLECIIERRDNTVPVSDTYRDADVLVISSVNEGITLTTIEALSAGVPVISTNVGSQKTLIPPDALLRRGTRNFVADASNILLSLLHSENKRVDLWEREMVLLEQFSKLESANELFDRLLKEWSNHAQ